MNLTEATSRAHWDEVYSSKRADEVSWHQARPELPLKLIRRTGVGRDAALIDVGGGASTLADHLLAEGFKDVSVLDIAAAGLAQARARLGGDAARIEWIAADITRWRPARRYALWHDRAVLHFLLTPQDQAAYAASLRAALPSGGWAIIGGFAPNGPTRCSGLEIVQHDTQSLSALLGADFVPMETHGEIHLTPHGREQAFRHHIFQRK
ncbi:methyltransferase domain-containing protein [Terricaulis sp.]|uniref:methyltransferase domain-containing protein n=1 Tax=Terricaulis sp. TaxID=2768686 RepID=UPI003784CCBB